MKSSILSIVVVAVAATFFGVVKSGGDPMESEKDRQLLKAVVKDDLATFEKLLQEGANPNVIFGKGPKDWVMCQVADKGRLDFLKAAIQHGGDINLRNPYTTKSTVKAIFSAPLLCAIRMHNDETFDYLLDEGVDINIEACTECKQERLRGSPITVAEHGNEYRMVVELINRRNGKLSDMEIKGLIHGIEKTTIDEKSEENAWRLEVVEWLRGQGHEVTPWVSSDECRRINCQGKS